MAASYDNDIIDVTAPHVYGQLLNARKTSD